jgi:hypothetical protein
MGSMKGKRAKIDAAFGRIADMIPSGNLLAGTDPVGFLDTVAAELKELRAENVNMKGTISIKQDRVNDLEKALRDSLRQLEKAINGNAMDGDWIAAELHGRECLYSQA